MILTIAEATRTLGEYADTINEADLTDELEAIDAYILAATGYEPGETIKPVAKKIARMLLVQWWDNPDGQTEQRNSGQVRSDYGVGHLVAQLRASIAKEEAEADAE